MLLEMAIGDAYGVAWEFADMSVTQPVNDLAGYYHNSRYPTLGGGRYTDDTQRSLAIAERLLRDRQPTYDQFAQSYLDTYHRDPRFGYSSKFSKLIEEYQGSAAFLDAIQPHGLTNGSVMGAAPIGFLKTAWDIKTAAYAQAMVTHAPETFRWAEAIAHMAHFFLYDLGTRAQLAEYLDDVVPVTQWRTPPRVFRRDMSASDSVGIVFKIISDTRIDSLAALLQRAVAFQGDTDTYGALVMAIGSGSREIDQTIPQPLIDGLENGNYGRDYLKSIDAQLMKMKSVVP